MAHSAPRCADRAGARAARAPTRSMESRAFMGVPFEMRSSWTAPGGRSPCQSRPRGPAPRRAARRGPAPGPLSQGGSQGEDRLTSALLTGSSSYPFLTKRPGTGDPEKPDEEPRERRDHGPATDGPASPRGRRDDAPRDERAGGAERQHLASRDPLLFGPAGARDDRARRSRREAHLPRPPDP